MRKFNVFTLFSINKSKTNIWKPKRKFCFTGHDVYCFLLSTYKQCLKETKEIQKINYVLLSLHYRNWNKASHSWSKKIKKQTSRASNVQMIVVLDISKNTWVSDSKMLLLFMFCLSPFSPIFSPGMMHKVMWLPCGTTCFFLAKVRSCRWWVSYIQVTVLIKTVQMASYMYL